jgi:hypothetical protein
LDDRPRVVFPPPGPFPGAGLYALYYTGGLSLYQPLRDVQVPIYVGKAEAGNSSYGDPPDQTQPSLYQRIANKHAGSVGEVARSHGGNVRPEDFEVRYLLLDDVWIVLGERALLRAYAPVLWNTLMPGFGANPPGTARNNARSIWDTIHPGRERAGQLCNRRLTRAEMEDRVRRGIDISLMSEGPERAAALAALKSESTRRIWAPAPRKAKDQRLRVFRVDAFLQENAELHREIADDEWVAAHGDTGQAAPDPEEEAEKNILSAERAETRDPGTADL